MKSQQILRVFIAVSFATSIFIACSKGGGTSTPANPCTGITITVSATSSESDAGVSNGSITATATGATGITFTLNSGTSQASGNFTNLAAGTYKITAKTAAGCSGTTSIAVKTKNACAGVAGPLFTAVKGVITTNCAVSNCHNGTQAPDYRDDCNIVAYADLIKTRAVDQAGTADQMPQPPRAPLAQADKDKIIAWINAGKHFTD